jgi:hypothetical protein
MIGSAFLPKTLGTAVETAVNPHLNPNKSNSITKRCATTRGLDFDHKIKARAHKGGMRIGKTPKKLASICCP